MNPLTAFLSEKNAATEGRKQQELALWSQWKETRTPEHLEPLLKLYEPVINQKMNLYKAPSIPKSAFKAELQSHLVSAFDKYNPDRGAALNTHVHIHLQKAMRFNNRYQNMAYIPEGQARYIGVIDRAHNELQEKFGRPPSNEEVAEHVGLPPARVARIQGARIRDIAASSFETDPTERGVNFEEQQIAVAQHVLPQLFPNKPEMATLFHYTFGTDGHERISSTTALAKRMGKTQPQISRMKTQLGETLRQRMGYQPR